MKQHTFKFRLSDGSTVKIVAATYKEAEAKAEHLDWVEWTVENYVDPNYRTDLEYVH
jgi:hypothetical protein